MKLKAYHSILIFAILVMSAAYLQRKQLPQGTACHCTRYEQSFGSDSSGK